MSGDQQDKSLKDKAERLLELFGELKSQRNKVEKQWSKLSRFISPRRGAFDWSDVSDNGDSGEDNTEDIFDDTAIRAARKMSEGLLGHIAPQNTRWFKIAYQDHKLNDNDIARAWLQDSEDVFISLMDRGNFFDALGELLHDGVVLGTANMSVIPNKDKTKIVFKARHMREIYIKCNDDGDVEIVFRRYRLSARDAIKKFGEDSFPSKWVKEAEKSPFKKFFFIHGVYPREDRLIEKVDAKNMPFASVHVMEDQSWFLRESGFVVPPGITWRFRTNSGEDYGSSNAWDIKTTVIRLNAMQKGFMNLANFVSNPPKNVPSNRQAEVRKGWKPGGMIAYTNPKMQTFPIAVGQNYPVTKDFIDGVQNQVSEGFDNELYLSLMANQGRDKTATEVNKISGEQVAMLAATVSRLNTEVFNNVFNRMFQICFDLEWLPEITEEIAQYIGAGLKIEYIGPLPQALKRHFNTQGTLAGVQIIQGVAQTFPNVLDVINSDKLGKNIMRSYGADEDVINDDANIEAMRQARAKRQQELEKQAALQSSADVIQKTSKAPEEGSAAKSMMGALSGQG